jgi:O-methyltransferase
MELSRALFRTLSGFLSSRNLFLGSSLKYKEKPLPLPPNLDYIRYSALGLCYEEIVNRKVAGNVAELGVYKGDFAKRLNFLFPDRKLYLFDTFEGFDSKDVEKEKSEGFSEGSQDFSDTSVEMVLSKMTNKSNCIVCKGFFPGTAEGIRDTFCFVSIDADLYEPVYNGLVFFYPLLEKGGYIFVHDFNNDEYKGAHQAVLKFCSENSIGFVPLADNGGTAVITR